MASPGTELAFIVACATALSWPARRRRRPVVEWSAHGGPRARLSPLATRPLGREPRRERGGARGCCLASRSRWAVARALHRPRAGAHRRHRPRRARPGSRRRDGAARGGLRLLAGAPVRAPAPVLRGMARRPHESRPPRRRAGPARLRGPLPSARADVVLVARRRRNLLRRVRAARNGGADLAPPALLSTGTARRRRAP